MADTTFHPPAPYPKQKPFYSICRLGILGWLDAVHSFHTRGVEHIPASGPFLLACNHASFIDPPAFAVACPRELHFFARKTLWKGVLAPLITSLNAIPIDRDGESDLQAFRKVFDVLNKGGALLVFPEGTRTRDGALQPAKKGIAMMACRAKVPVIPARIFGSYEVLNRSSKFPNLRQPMHVSFGPALLPEKFDPGKTAPDRYEQVSATLMAAIAKLS